MANSAYVDWLNDYQTKVSQMSAEEVRKENHETDRHPSQVYADYLDYVDEWSWHQKEQVSALTSATVYSLSLRRQKIQCGEHEHTLARIKTEQDNTECTVVDLPNRAIHHECWYRTIRNTVESVLNNSTRANVRMPDPLETALTRIASWKLTKSDTSPTLLPFDTFKTVWWSAAENGGTSKLAHDMLERLNLADRQHVAEMRTREIPETKPTQNKIVYWFPHSDHGFHTLYRALGHDEFNKVLRFLNNARRQRGAQDRIKMEDISRKIESCILCQANGPHRLMSHPGIYYAPPGIGKTTAMDKELLIGFDTDWVGTGITWYELSPLLNMKIPIVTNQNEGFVGSALKIVGTYHANIRTDEWGIPYTTVANIEAHAKAQPINCDFTRVDDGTHLADWILHMQVKQVLQNMIAEHCINSMPFYRSGIDEEWSKVWTKLIKNPWNTHVT